MKKCDHKFEEIGVKVMQPEEGHLGALAWHNEVMWCRRCGGICFKNRESEKITRIRYPVVRKEVKDNFQWNSCDLAGSHPPRGFFNGIRKTIRQIQKARQVRMKVMTKVKS